MKVSARRVRQTVQNSLFVDVALVSEEVKRRAHCFSQRKEYSAREGPRVLAEIGYELLAQDRMPDHVGHSVVVPSVEEDWMAKYRSCLQVLPVQPEEPVATANVQPTVDADPVEQCHKVGAN